METINYECYVSLEVAKLLKKAGFDWEVNHSYPDREPLDNSCSGYMEDLSFYHNLNDGKYGGISVPTLEVAQRWLREVKGIEFDLCCHLTLDNQYKYAYAIKIKSIWKGLDKGKEIEVPSMDCLEAETCFNTFEEAQEAGIKKALELILEKGK